MIELFKDIGPIRPFSYYTNQYTDVHFDSATYARIKGEVESVLYLTARGFMYVKVDDYYINFFDFSLILVFMYDNKLAGKTLEELVVLYNLSH